MTRPTAGLLALLVPVIALGVGLVVGASDRSFGTDPASYLFDAATGVVLALAGVVAWDRRPRWRTGPLLVLAGYLWYIGSLYVLVPDDSIVPLGGFAFRGYYDVILAFVVLTVPGDRFRTVADRAVVLGLFATMALRTGWRLIAVPPGAGPGYGPDAPASPFLLVRDVGRFIDVDIALSFVVGIALSLVALAAVRRLVRSRPGERRVATPVLAGGAMWAALAGLYAMAGLAGELGLDLVPSSGPGFAAQYLVRILGPLGLLIGMLRLRGGSAAAVALLADGHRPPRGNELEGALRQALGDPGVRLLYPGPDDEWVTIDGHAALLPGLGEGRAVTILEAGDRRVGAVVHDETLLDDPVVIRTVTAVVGLAVDNERLQDDLRTQLGEVRASRTRIVEAADAERRRVERDLHDGAQQRLVALAVSLRTIRTRLGDQVEAGVSSELDAAGDEVRLAIAELRELAQGLDPAILREAGLGAAVRSLADRSPVPVAVELELDGRLPARVETAAYFVASEALANVAKHARATRVTLRAEHRDERLRLEVADNGVGGADIDGAGLRGLVDRIAAVDGSFLLTTPPGGGTTIEVTIPCGS